jgi:UDP-glucuronate decarboxylase
MRLLITGGCGFIGSHLSERLVRDGHEVTVIDKKVVVHRTTGVKENYHYEMHAEDPKCSRVILDHNVEGIVHLASDPISEDGLSNADILHANATALSNILTLARKHGVRKVVVVSSVSVYGAIGNSPVDETAPIDPITEIGMRHLALESICANHRLNGLRIVLIRTSTVYGPLQGTLSTSSVLDAIRALDAGKTLRTSETDPPMDDYLYVGDFVEAVSRILENDTSAVLNETQGMSTTQSDLWGTCRKHFPSESGIEAPVGSTPEGLVHASVHRFDNRLARFELDWCPMVDLEEGVRRTVEWWRKQPVSGRTETRKARGRRWFASLVKSQQDLFVIGFFLLTALLTYVFQYRLQIDADLFLLYIVAINLLLGLKHGSLAIVLSISARVFLILFLDGVRVLDFLNDASRIIYLVIYFTIGIVIGIVSDHRRTEDAHLQSSMELLQTDLAFIDNQYRMALESKNALQTTIENYSESFGKSVEIFNRLKNVEPELIYLESALIISSMMKVQTVHIYQVTPGQPHLRLMAVAGTLKYSRSLRVDQFPSLKSSIDQKRTVVNRNLDESNPRLCAPILHDDTVIAVVLIDQIDFMMLNQQFLNTLKVITMMVSMSLAVDEAHRESINERRFFHQTRVMKKEWFRRILVACQAMEIRSQQPVCILKVVDPIDDYRAFTHDLSKLVREQDIVGEISDDHVGIIFMNALPEDLPLLRKRFKKTGYPVTPVKIRDL